MVRSVRCYLRRVPDLSVVSRRRRRSTVEKTQSLYVVGLGLDGRGLVHCGGETGIRGVGVLPQYYCALVRHLHKSRVLPKLVVVGSSVNSSRGRVRLSTDRRGQPGTSHVPVTGVRTGGLSINYSSTIYRPDTPEAKVSTRNVREFRRSQMYESCSQDSGRETVCEIVTPSRPTGSK